MLLDASDLGIRFLTVYAFSAENWRRPQDEVDGLMALIEQAAREELGVMHRNNVRIRVAGRMNELPVGLKQALEEGIETTKANTGIGFTLAINYGGRAEIVDALTGLVAEGVGPGSITEDAISARMYNPDVPDPDLLIRTAGEMRWSNFLLWQAAYSELWVTDATWPEFESRHLLEAVKTYQTRVRKFGGLAEPGSPNCSAVH